MKYPVLMLLTLLVAACASSPQQPSYYLLSEPSNEARALPVDAPGLRITLSRLTLASYLNQTTLAFLQGPHQVVYAYQHLWAERLQEGLQRVLVNDFNRLGAARLLVSGEPGAATSDYQLQLQVDQFLPTDAGQVVLSGQYWLLQSGQLIARQDFELRETLQRDGYRHSVEVQRQLLGQLAEGLNRAVQQIAAVANTTALQY